MRKIIQISTSTSPGDNEYYRTLFITALCDDGTLWLKSSKESDGHIFSNWFLLEEIPQTKL